MLDSKLISKFYLKSAYANKQHELFNRLLILYKHAQTEKRNNM
jgi:hypothetical protein